MRNVAIAAAGLCLAGCSSMPSFDFLRPTPPSVTVNLDSLPPGADARTSNGGACKTPCSISVPAENFTVTYTLAKYQSETFPVTVALSPEGGPPIIDPPNPISVELKPLGPPPKAKKKPRVAQAKASRAAPAESSPFPPPPQR